MEYLGTLLVNCFLPKLLVAYSIQIIGFHSSYILKFIYKNSAYFQNSIKIHYPQTMTQIERS